MLEFGFVGKVGKGSVGIQNFGCFEKHYFDCCNLDFGNLFSENCCFGYCYDDLSWDCFEILGIESLGLSCFGKKVFENFVQNKVLVKNLSCFEQMEVLVEIQNYFVQKTIGFENLV